MSELGEASLVAREGRGDECQQQESNDRGEKSQEAHFALKSEVICILIDMVLILRNTVEVNGYRKRNRGTSP
jgi:hypothetical protein